MNPANYEKIVIKVGTVSIMDSYGPRKEFMTTLVSEISRLEKKGKQVVLVTSGAVGFGRTRLQNDGRDIPSQQGLAAIGQVLLMKEYIRRFENVNLEAAQILVSQRDLVDEESTKNLKNTMDFLFKNRVVAIVNENDVVSTEELKHNAVFGDNDELSAMIARTIGADLLVIITTKNGLLGRDGRVIKEITNLAEVPTLNTYSRLGRGGIAAKITAIGTAQQNGISVYVSGPETFEGFSEGNSSGTLVYPKK